MFRVFKAVGEQAGTTEYANRTVKYPSSLYELGIFTPKYVNRTVQEAIYCMICVLTSRAGLLFENTYSVQ